MNEDIRRIAKTLDSVGITQRYPKTAFEELQVARAATNRVTDALIRPYSHMALEFPKPLFRSLLQDAIGAQTAFPKPLFRNILQDAIGAQTAFPKPLFRNILQDAIGAQTAFPKPLFRNILQDAIGAQTAFPKPLFRNILQDAIGAQTAFPKPLFRNILQDAIGAQTAFPKPLFRNILQDAIGAQTAFPKPLFEGITGGSMQSGLLAGITGASMPGLLDDINIQSAHAIPLREVIGLPTQDEEYTIVQVPEDFPTAYIEHRTPQVHLPQKLQFNKQLLIKWVRVGWDWLAIVQRICWVVENVSKLLS